MDMDAPSYFTLDQLTNELSLQSNKQSDITDQPVTVPIFAALQNYNAVQQAQIDIEIFLIDLCERSNIAFEPIVSDMVAAVRKGPKEQDLKTKIRAISKDGDTMEVSQSCSPVVYSIPTTTISALTKTDNKLILESNDSQDATDVQIEYEI